MAPGITLVDSGALILAATGPGVAHPAGFPAWVLIAHLATLFATDPITSVNAVSVFAGVLMVHLLWRLARHFSSPKSNVEELGPLSAALLAAWAFPVWGTATFAEVYSVTSSALVASLLLTEKWRQHRGTQGYLSVPMHLWRQ